MAAVLLWGIASGVATGAVSVPLAAIIANRWFQRRRGLVMGLSTVSNASGQLVFLPLLAGVAGFDWRYVAGLVAVVAAVLVLPVVVAFLRGDPATSACGRSGRTRRGVSLRPPGRRSAPRSTRGCAAHSRTFWLLAATFFVCGATTNGLIQTHLIPAAHDHGITQVPAGPGCWP